jgi:hypothetical protein
MAENLGVGFGSISTMAAASDLGSSASEDANDQERMSSSMASQEEIHDHNKIRAFAETILYMANRKEAKRVAATTSTTVDHPNDNDNHPSMGNNILGSFNSTTGGISRGDENKYDHYDDAELEAFAEFASPKVSELLKEQALALDDIMMNTSSAWSEDGDSDDYSSASSQMDAEQNLKDELDAAANDFSQMWNGGDEQNDDDYEVLGHIYSGPKENGEKAACGVEANNCTSDSEEWSNSIHQHYTDNRPSTGDLSNTKVNNSGTKNNPYSLSDHARTLHLSRSEAKFGIHTKPFLARTDLETSSIVTMPRWIVRPRGEVTSRVREGYFQRILDCTVEYIEPLKSKTLRRLFSGWNPGPGERKSEDDGGERVVNQGVIGGGGDYSQRIMPYAPAGNSAKDDCDSSIDGEDDDYGFEDIGGLTYGLNSQQHVREPLPARTVTVRIRCDVMCGAVMDSLTTSVERLGGEMTKRQGGVSAAVCSYSHE